MPWEARVNPKLLANNKSICTGALAFARMLSADGSRTESCQERQHSPNSA